MSGSETILPAWRKLYRLLRHDVAHCTSREGLEGILERGAILPNNGEFPSTFTDKNYARSRNLVCLFDFATPTEEESMRHADKWGDFLYRHKPVSIILRLERSFPLISNESAYDEINYRELYFPRVEAWHEGSIASSHIRDYLVVCSVAPEAVEVVSSSETALAEIDAVTERYRVEFASDYETHERVKRMGALGWSPDEKLQATLSHLVDKHRQDDS